MWSVLGPLLIVLVLVGVLIVLEANS